MHWMLLMLVVSLAGCGPFSGTRHGSPWAQEVNYLQGQRRNPEELGIVTTNLGPYTAVTWPEAILGEEKATLPLTLRGGVTIPVVVNGTKRVPAVPDTGAPFNLVALTLAYNLQLPVTRPRYLPKTISGYGGASTDCGWSLLSSLQLGGITFTNALASIPLEKFDQVTFFGFLTLNHDEFVILGLDGMTKMSYVTFDFPRREMTFARSEPYICAAREKALVVPCKINPGPTLTAEIKVDGKGPFPCRIDTGKTVKAPALTIPQKLAEELGYTQPGRSRTSRQVGTGGGFESQRFQLKTFEIGGQTFSNLPADTHFGAGEFILGLSFLADYRLTLDVRGRNIYLEK